MNARVPILDSSHVVETTPIAMRTSTLSRCPYCWRALGHIQSASNARVHTNLYNLPDDRAHLPRISASQREITPRSWIESGDGARLVLLPFYNRYVCALASRIALFLSRIMTMRPCEVMALDLYQLPNGMGREGPMPSGTSSLSDTYGLAPPTGIMEGTPRSSRSRAFLDAVSHCEEVP